MPKGVHPKEKSAQDSALGDYPLVYKPDRFAKSGSLVALSSAAVFMVWAAGFVRTNPASNRFGYVAVATRAAASGIWHLKDGTYTGWGSCYHGDLEALVVVRNGRIVAASVVQCFTRYSRNVIAQLPGQVVARQNASIDLVSRATESSEAFIIAVTRALAKAQ